MFHKKIDPGFRNFVGIVSTSTRVVSYHPGMHRDTTRRASLWTRPGIVRRQVLEVQESCLSQHLCRTQPIASQKIERLIEKPDQKHTLNLADTPVRLYDFEVVSQ